MEDRHLSLETMAKWLTGRLEHDEMLREVVPHHLEQCPACRDTYRELQRIKEEVGHWDEEVALLESREAPELAARLESTPDGGDDRGGGVEGDDTLHTWGLCQLLLRKSLAAIREDPGRVFELANDAVRLTAHLGEAYDPQWVLGPGARGRANARRVLAELRSADADFREARTCLSRSAWRARGSRPRSWIWKAPSGGTSAGSKRPGRRPTARSPSIKRTGTPTASARCSCRQRRIP